MLDVCIMVCIPLIIYTTSNLQGELRMSELAQFYLLAAN